MLYIQYYEIDDNDIQTERCIKLMMDWMILNKTEEAFNRQYQIEDSIRERFNDKGRQNFELLPIMVGLAGSVWLIAQS